MAVREKQRRGMKDVSERSEANHRQVRRVPLEVRSGCMAVREKQRRGMKDVSERSEPPERSGARGPRERRCRGVRGAKPLGLKMDLSVSIGGLTLANPLIAASGC